VTDAPFDPGHDPERRTPHEPVPVVLMGPDPVPVSFAPPPPVKPTQAVQAQGTDPSLPATTTFQQDLTFAGQRHINVMWERTQQIIAITVSVVTLAVCAFLIGKGPTELSLLAFTLLSNVFFLVVGTYFQRTNHTKTGGVPAGDNTTR